MEIPDHISNKVDLIMTELATYDNGTHLRNIRRSAANNMAKRHGKRELPKDHKLTPDEIKKADAFIRAVIEDVINDQGHEVFADVATAEMAGRIGMYVYNKRGPVVAPKNDDTLER